MTSTSRRYYEMELGAGVGPSPGFNEQFGYTEPLRRFIQRESFEPQANEIPNTMPSWMPGDDYYTNFRVGDPYVKVDQGFAPGLSVLPRNKTLAHARAKRSRCFLVHVLSVLCVAVSLEAVRAGCRQGTGCLSAGQIYERFLARARGSRFLTGLPVLPTTNTSRTRGRGPALRSPVLLWAPVLVP
jgi:hypothetical protein